MRYFLLLFFYLLIGTASWAQPLNLPEARQKLDSLRKLPDKTVTLEGFIEIGQRLRNQGFNTEALITLQEAARLADALNDAPNKARTIHKIGVFHLLRLNHEQALLYAKQEEVVWREIADGKNLGRALNFKGLTQINLEKFDSARISLREAMLLAEESRDTTLLAKIQLNLGDSYLRQQDIKQALPYIEKAHALSKESKDRYTRAIILLKLGQAHTATGNYTLAENNILWGLDAAKAMHSMALLRNGYMYLKDLYLAMGQYEQAFKAQTQYHAYKDSLLSEHNQQQLVELQAQFESEQKDQEIKLLEQETRLQVFTKYALFGIVAVLLAAMAFGFFRLQESKKHRAQLENQNHEMQTLNEEVSMQSEVIRQKNLKITESINYARKIQDAIRIDETDFTKHFPENFLIYLPRDIVSGDTTWFAQHRETYYVAVVDCTGHGVPAAFMTVLCNTLLADIFEDLPEIEPAQFLSEIHRRLSHVLHQAQSHIRDGMDMVLCRLDRPKHKLLFAGAKIPLLYTDKQGKLHRLKGSSKSVGGYKLLKDGKEAHDYGQAELAFSEVETIYLATDGFQDQFGGTKDKKFLSRRFRELLAEVQGMPMKKQEEHIREAFFNWKGNYAQTDDVTVMGFCIPD